MTGSNWHSPQQPAKRFRTMKSSNYDVNNTCNLTCEGCYYFVSGQKTHNKRPTPADYDAFFASEYDRGVNYPVFSGGEPSLNPAALRTAARYWTNGIIYTNGVKKIPAEVTFRIAISVWGARARNERLRGAQSYDHAFDAARGDPRAMIYFTISRDNIDDIEAVVLNCVREGIDVSFQDFSMTSDYMRMLEEAAPGASPYFRFSTADDNLSLSMTDRARAADILDEMMNRYPERIIFSRELNDLMHRAPAIHTIDPLTNIATDCAILNAPWHLSYGYDLKELGGKPCCAPEFDCRDCRVGPVSTFTLLAKSAREMRHSPAARQRFENVRDLMMRFYFWDWVSPAVPDWHNAHGELALV